MAELLLARVFMSRGYRDEMTIRTECSASCKHQLLAPISNIHQTSSQNSPLLNITPAMTSNLLQGVLKHSAHERFDAFVHDKDDDSDDELVNVVRSISYFCWTTVSLKMPSFHLQEHLHALAHQRGPHHRLAGHQAVSPIDLHFQHLPNNLPIPSGYSRLRYLSGYSLYWASVTSLDAHVSLGNGARVRP
jgi:hypothetical protein